MTRKRVFGTKSLIKLHSDSVNRLTNMGLGEVFGVVFPTNKHNTKAKLREKLAKKKQQKNK